MVDVGRVLVTSPRSKRSRAGSRRVGKMQCRASSCGVRDGGRRAGGVVLLLLLLVARGGGAEI